MENTNKKLTNAATEEATEKKKPFEPAKLDIIKFGKEDIIRTSTGEGGDENAPDDGWV